MSQSTQSAESMIHQALSGGHGSPSDQLAAMMQIFESLLPPDAKALYERLKLRNDQDPLSAEFHNAFNGEPLRDLRETLQAKFKQPAENIAEQPAAHSNQNTATAKMRRAETGMMANYMQSQLLNQTNFAAPMAAPVQTPQTAATPPVHGAMSPQENITANMQQIDTLSARIANGTEAPTDADRTEWVQAQNNLKQSVMNYAADISKLPPNSPERAAAQAEMAKLSEKLTATELPVMARFDKNFGESWKHFHDTKPGSEGAVLPTRMKMYGITDEQMNKYIATGQEPDGLKKAVENARRSGDWPALGVVRASYQMRADYLRATASPDDAASRKQADQLDAAATGLSRNRNAIHMNWGAEKYSKLSEKYPDESTRPAKVQKQMDEAKDAVASVRSKAVDQVTAHPERYGKNSPTRKLAGDALTTEARMIESEGKIKMEREAKANNETTEVHNKTLKPDQEKVVPPPPKVPAELAEGGAVDQKRTDAVKIDPTLGDVVHGGDRALQFHRDTMNTKKLRLNMNEQQAAHLASKGQKPPAELAAKVNTQVEDIFKNTLETHDKLTRQKPGSLSVDQTKLLSELDGDATTYAAKISNTAHQKSGAEMDYRLKNQSQQTVQRGLEDLDKASQEFEKAKVERVRNEMHTNMALGKVNLREMSEFNDNPAAYAKKMPDTKEEAKYRAELATAKTEGNTILAEAKKTTADAKQQYDYSKKVDDLDRLNTDAEMAAGLAKDALTRSEAHMKAIPASGPERLPRLQAAADHQSAVIGLSTVIRNNADARIGRTAMSHNEVESVYQGQAAPLIDDPVGKSAENLAKVTADETEVKRGAFKDAKNAAAESDQIRKDIGAELDKAHSNLPKSVQMQRAAELQGYKDSLALQQVRAHGVVADLGADLDPNAAREQLDQGTKLIDQELPYAHVSRTNKQQAAMEHARNEMRARALADHGDASIEVAKRAQFNGGAEYGMLAHDALATAGKSASDLNTTLTIDGGGAAGNTANKKVHEELANRAKKTVNDVNQMNDSVDPLKFADAIDRELAKDVEEFQKLNGDLAKAMKDQRGDAFGLFANTVSRVRGAIDGQGGDLNKIGLEIGNEYLRLGGWRGRAQAGELKKAAQTIRDMHAAGIPNHVIMGSLRDPRFAELRPKFFNPNTNDEARTASQKFHAEITGQIKSKYGIALPEGFMGAGYGIRDTSLGKVLDNARSNRTDNIVTYLGHKHTDLLREGKAELREHANMANEDWKKVAPYAAVTQVVDQVVFSMASGAALAGVFARAASFTRIPQAFAAARGAAAGMSGAGRIAVLAGVNASEAGLGMLTGAAMGKVGDKVFGEGSTGAKMFGYVGGGFQLSNASKVAMRSGLGFQAAMGLTLGGVPIVAQELGASPALAEKLGMASGIFLPTVLGTMSNRNTLRRAEHVMVNELGVDPTKARTVMGDLFHAESTMDPRFVKNGAFDVEGFTRERAGKLIDNKFPELSPAARTTILDNASVDAARRRIQMEPPTNGTAKEKVQFVEEFHGRLESELVKMGVQPDRARDLALTEKNDMYQQSIATTNARAGREEGPPEGPSDPNSPNRAGASTREMIDQTTRTEQPDVRLLLSTKGADGRPVQTQSDLPLKLVAIDRANDRALVKFPDGSMKQVKANEVIYVNNGMQLGALPPAVQRSFDINLNNLSGDDKLQWSNMLGEANKKSQEHVGVLKRMLASGATIDEIRGIHQKNMKLSHEEIGQQYSPANLAQHLRKSCVAACIQKVDIFFKPQRGQDLNTPKAQLDGQVGIMERQDVGWEVRRGETYPHSDVPPATDKQWREARVNDYEGKPPILTKALQDSNHSDYNIFGLNNLDRRHVHEQLQNVSLNRPEYLFARGQDGKNVVYEVSNRESTPSGDRIFVRKRGEQNGQWWNTRDIRLEEEKIPNPRDNRIIMNSEDKVLLPDGSVLSHIAVPPDRPVKQAESGINLVKDDSIQNIVRASTGKTLKRHEIKGDDALHAIYQSVQDIGVAGASVKWEGQTHGHQLLVTGARDLGGGKYSFDVFDPTTGTTRTVSGDQLKSQYNSGHPNDNGKGFLEAVQVPHDQVIGRRGGLGSEELAARNQIELHEPDKLNTLKQIDALPNPGTRSVLTQMLRHEGNDEAMTAVLRNSIPDLANLDANTQRDFLNLYKNNRLMMFRGPLVEMMPTIARLPEAARNHALEQLNSMQGNDLMRTAQRLQNATNPGRMDDDLAMQFALRIFGGGDPAQMPAH